MLRQRWSRPIDCTLQPPSDSSVVIGAVVMGGCAAAPASGAALVPACGGSDAPAVPGIAVEGEPALLAPAIGRTEASFPVDGIIAPASDCAGKPASLVPASGI